MDEAERARAEIEVEQVAEEIEIAAENEEDATSNPTLVDLVLAEHATLQAQEAPALPARIDGVLVGHIAALDSPDAPRVTFPGAPPEGFVARAMTLLGAEDVGREVALMFEGGIARRPIVMGRMASAPPASAALPVAEVDGKRVEISAAEEIVLRCGEASITLTRAGKIILRGAYVLSRSSGVNRIQGGSVQIN